RAPDRWAGAEVPTDWVPGIGSPEMEPELRERELGLLDELPANPSHDCDHDEGDQPCREPKRAVRVFGHRFTRPDWIASLGSRVAEQPDSEPSYDTLICFKASISSFTTGSGSGA